MISDISGSVGANYSVHHFSQAAQDQEFQIEEKYLVFNFEHDKENLSEAVFSNGEVIEALMDFPRIKSKLEGKEIFISEDDLELPSDEQLNDIEIALDEFEDATLKNEAQSVMRLIREKSGRIVTRLFYVLSFVVAIGSSTRITLDRSELEFISSMPNNTSINIDADRNWTNVNTGSMSLFVSGSF